MSKLRLTMACSDYDLTHAFVDGTVQVEGVDLNVVVTVPHERHHRVLRGEFDVSEFSIANYLTLRPRGLPYTAIPVFPLRVFRHSYIFVRADSPIRDPRELAGRRIGVNQYVNSAGLWARGVLQHEYDVDLSDVTWISEWPEPSLWQPNVPISFEWLGPNKVAEQALVDGEVEALLYPKVPNALRRGGNVRRLFPDYVQVEQEYYRRTGVFPIMHTIIVRDEVLQKDPWVGTSLMKAWQEAKRACYLRYFRAVGYSCLPWLSEHLSEQEQVLGSDAFPYSLEANWRTLDAAVQYAYEQHFVDEPLSLDGLFAASTRGAQVEDVVGSFYGY